MLHDTVGLIRQATYWLIQRHRATLGIEQQVARLRPGIRELARAPLQWLQGADRAAFEARASELAHGRACRRTSRDGSRPATRCTARPTSSNWRESRRITVEAAARAYFGIGAHFGLDWLRSHIEGLDTEGHWHAVARGSLREALFEVHRSLAQGVLEGTRETDPGKAVEKWLERHKAAAEHARGGDQRHPRADDRRRFRLAVGRAAGRPPRHDGGGLSGRRDAHLSRRRHVRASRRARTRARERVDARRARRTS